MRDSGMATAHFFFLPSRLYNRDLRQKLSFPLFLHTPTSTTLILPVVSLMSPQSNVADYRKRCLAKGTYLAAPTEEFTWFTVEATKVSYLIRASDAPPPDTVLEPSDRPAPVELAMIVKVFRSSPFSFNVLICV